MEQEPSEPNITNLDSGYPEPAGGELIEFTDRADQILNMINQVPVVGKTMANLGSIAVEIYGSMFGNKQALQNAEAAKAQKRADEIKEGRQLGLRIIEKFRRGEEMNEYDEAGNYLSNTWEQFQAIDPSITYAEMGFDKVQVAILEIKREQHL